DAAPFQADIDDFIDQAPDGRKSIKRTGKKCAITVSIDPAVLERLNDWARGKGDQSVGVDCRGGGEVEIMGGIPHD
ncbi:MAG: hypothetical protein Q7T25_15815, partial [Sideroxyarcus sp.]|nr:hypothetical protein [Sideroxyarcus sp.]